MGHQCAKIEMPFIKPGTGWDLMNKIATVGVDLAKNVIVVCAADAHGHVQFFSKR